jgi:anaerobic magnesium-protoporphyrin IX monomethyl ester cyclase
VRFDGDFVNALYLTPHSWTPLGRALAEAPVVENDLSRWDYRHQVIGVKRLSPLQLFLGVKIVELLYHVHPRRLWRMIVGPDPTMRRQLRFAGRHIWGVFWYELYERLADRLTGRLVRASLASPSGVRPGISLRPNRGTRTPAEEIE